MRSKMLNKVVLPAEGAGTFRATEWFLLGVCSEMAFEVFQSLELPPAEVKGTLVHAIVPIQIARTIGKLG